MSDSPVTTNAYQRQRRQQDKHTDTPQVGVNKLEYCLIKEVYDADFLDRVKTKGGPTFFQQYTDKLRRYFDIGKTTGPVFAEVVLMDGTQLVVPFLEDLEENYTNLVGKFAAVQFAANNIRSGTIIKVAQRDFEKAAVLKLNKIYNIIMMVG